MSTESFALVATIFGVALLAIVLFANQILPPVDQQGLTRVESNRLLDSLKLYAAEMDFRLRADEAGEVNEDILQAAIFDAFKRDYSEDPATQEFRGGEMARLRQKLANSYERYKTQPPSPGPSSSNPAPRRRRHGNPCSPSSSSSRPMRRRGRRLRERGRRRTSTTGTEWTTSANWRASGPEEPFSFRTFATVATTDPSCLFAPAGGTQNELVKPFPFRINQPRQQEHPRPITPL